MNNFKDYMRLTLFILFNWILMKKRISLSLNKCNLNKRPRKDMMNLKETENQISLKKCLEITIVI